MSPVSTVRLVSGGVAGLMTILALAGTSATVLATAACGNTDSQCDSSLSACSTAAVYKKNIDVTSDQLPNLAIVFCVDTTCWTLTPARNDDGSYTCTSDPAGASCGLAQDEDSGYDLSITTTGTLDVSSGSASLTASITDTTDNSQILPTLTKVELYTPVYLNGTECPASCDVATLE